MSTTPNNGIDYVPENTTDPAAGLNLALDTIDALLQLAVIGIETAPPCGASDGDRYIVDTGATGDWSGEDNKVARYVATGDYWQFHEAKIALNLSDSKIYLNSGGWAEYTPSAGIAYSAVITESTTSRTLAKSDEGKYILCNNASGCTIDIPPQSSVAWVDNVEIHGRGSLGLVDFVPDSSVTLDYADGLSAVAQIGAAWTLKRESADSWVLIGYLEPIS